jgi:hypothetical protein
MLEAILIPWASFSLATAIASMWQLFNPIFKELPEDHVLRRHPVFCRVSWFFTAALIAPVLVPAIVVEEYRKAYIEGFLVGTKDV